MALFDEDEDDDRHVKLDAWMWWVIAAGALITMVVTFFAVRAIAGLL